MLQELGAYVVSADQIVHQLFSLKTVTQQIISLLGDKVIINGEIDRKKVAEIVFQSSERLRALEALLHPIVREEIQKHYERAMMKNYPLFVVEIPLLFETEATSFYDSIVAVFCDEKIAASRFIEKTGCTKQEYEHRMQRQLSPEKKAERADFIVNNNGTKEELKQSAITLYYKLTKQ